jgi:hypothetical protein
VRLRKRRLPSNASDEGVGTHEQLVRVPKSIRHYDELFAPTTAGACGCKMQVDCALFVTSVAPFGC